MSDHAEQITEISRMLKELKPATPPIAAESHIQEIVGQNSLESAKACQLGAVLAIEHAGTDLVEIKDRGDATNILPLPLKEPTYNSPWKVAIHVDKYGDQALPVVILSEPDTNSATQWKYSRYIPTPVEDYLALSNNLVDEEKSEIRAQATPSGNLLVPIDSQSGEIIPPKTGAFNTFVDTAKYLVGTNIRQIIDYQSGRKFKEFTDESLLRAEITSVANDTAISLQNPLETIATHLRQKRRA